MRQRSVSAIGVVAVGLVPATLGGWLFAAVFTGIVLVAYHEAIQITNAGSNRVAWLGYCVVALGGLLPMIDGASNLAGIVVSLAVGLPLAAAVFLSEKHAIADWSTTTATSLYLALPALAAVSLRGSDAFSARDWLSEIAGMLPAVSDATGGGLAWFLLALLVTWLSDTFAYLTGKTWGRRKLFPRVSPNKTVEGALGGLVAAAVTAIMCDWIFGMDIGAVGALVLGVGLGAIGMIGDLAESMLKRQRGIKDSGHLIPGHGGMLDRIDALIFVLVATWLIAPAFG